MKWIPVGVAMGGFEIAVGLGFVMGVAGFAIGAGIMTVLTIATCLALDAIHPGWDG